jgi:leader peptidase (prepilin peptidase)/N-methyltransferase
MYLIFFIFGLIIGSFLNVVIYRLPEGESLVKPRSHCTNCGTTLKVFDLIPIFSYLINKGKCRYCGGKISLQYPLIELLTAVLFLLTYINFGLTSKTFVYLYLISLLIAAAVIDYQRQIIPNKITYAGFISGLFFALVFNYISIQTAIIGSLIPAAFLLIVILIYPQGMGMGDLKLVAVIGTFTGWQVPLIGIFIGSFIGVIMALPFLISGKFNSKTKLPFGPLIITGSLIMIFWQEELIKFYFNLFL